MLGVLWTEGAPAARTNRIMAVQFRYNAAYRPLSHSSTS